MTRTFIALALGLVLGAMLPRASADTGSAWTRSDVSRLVRAVERIADRAGR